MRAKWTEFIQEGVEMLGMKPKLLTRMGWFPVFFFFHFLAGNAENSINIACSLQYFTYSQWSSIILNYKSK